MGIEIGAQLDALWRSLFLGAAFALLYDGLRALRLRRRTRRALTDLLDALYCLFLTAALLAFTLRIGAAALYARLHCPWRVPELRAPLAAPPPALGLLGRLSLCLRPSSARAASAGKKILW